MRITLQLGNYFIFLFFLLNQEPFESQIKINSTHYLLLYYLNVLFEVVGGIIFWLFAYQSTAPQLWTDARIETVNISWTGKATETEKGAAVLVPAGIAADGSTRDIDSYIYTQLRGETLRCEARVASQLRASTAKVPKSSRVWIGAISRCHTALSSAAVLRVWIIKLHGWRPTEQTASPH